MTGIQCPPSFCFFILSVFLFLLAHLMVQDGCLRSSHHIHILGSRKERKGERQRAYFPAKPALYKELLYQLHTVLLLPSYCPDISLMATSSCKAAVSFSFAHLCPRKVSLPLRMKGRLDVGWRAAVFATCVLHVSLGKVNRPKIMC